MYAFGEIFFARNQTQNQKSILREIVEMARVDEDIFLAEQIESEVFVGTRGRNAEDDAPKPAAKITRSGDTTVDRSRRTRPAGVVLPTPAAIPYGFATPPHATVAGSV